MHVKVLLFQQAPQKGRIPLYRFKILNGFRRELALSCTLCV